jgi:hypothetical protein
VFDPTLTPQQRAEVEKVGLLHLHEYGLAANDSYVHLAGDVSKTLGKKVEGFATKSLKTIMKVPPLPPPPSPLPPPRWAVLVHPHNRVCMLAAKLPFQFPSIC